MSRYTGPTTRINRRFGMAIFPANKSFERRTYPPGQHGPNFRRKARIIVQVYWKNKNFV